jgi:acyl-CoA thioester hydrolase
MNGTTTIVKEPESLLIARFQDCDPFGHLNNARYIDYFLNARQDQIAKYYNLRTYEQGMQASWVISTTQIAYVRPVLAMEEVLVRTRLLHFDDTSLVVEGRMLDKGEKYLKSLIWFEFVYISLSNGRPVKHPDELMSLLTSAAFSGEYEPSGFHRRVELVRRQTRKQPESAGNIGAE